jgi:hypothetical protein
VALVALCLWVVSAWLLMISTTAKQSWPAAYGLIAVGLPLLGWLWLEGGPLQAALGLIVMGGVLRWPLRYAWRWIVKLVR